MGRLYDVITFDCYGTLIDWERGIREACLTAAAADGVNLDHSRIMETYAREEAQVQRETYRPYREVVNEVALRVAAALGWNLASERARFLAGSLGSWRPFPDTNRALERLKASGHRLGILSNIDDDLLALTRKHFTVDFDLVVTAEQVRSYKPGRAHFDEARKRIGSARWLHAAQSNYHDIVPANAMAIPTAWINRKGEQALAGGVPKHEFRDLASACRRF